VAERLFIDFGPVGSLRNGRQDGREEGAQKDASHRNKCSAIDSTDAAFSPQRENAGESIQGRLGATRDTPCQQRVMPKSRSGKVESVGQRPEVAVV